MSLSVVPELPNNGSHAPERGDLAAAAHSGSEKLTESGGRWERPEPSGYVHGKKTRTKAGPLEKKDKAKEGQLEAGEAMGKYLANRASVSPSVKPAGGGPFAGEVAGEF